MLHTNGRHSLRSVHDYIGYDTPHKLGEKEWAFVGEQCKKLEDMGFIRKSYQSHYASATVVVRKKDENGEYTDFRKCGDYRPLNLETD